MRDIWIDKRYFHLSTFCEKWSRAARVQQNSRLMLLPAIVACLISSPILAVTPDNTLSATSKPIQSDARPSMLQTVTQVKPEGMTRQQGDAILRELRSIRSLLQKQQAQSKSNRRAPPANATIKLGDHPSLGQVDAPVLMVEFTDYQCPYCKRFHDITLPEIQKKYIDTGKLRYVTLDLPLKFHQQARPAAEAARCAGEQNKFWPMRKILFGNPRALDKKSLLGYAGDLALDINAFKSCLEDNRHEQGIQSDIKIARSAGFTGTPSFVIGRNVKGQMSGATLIGAKPFTEFERYIQKHLPKAGG